MQRLFYAINQSVWSTNRNHQRSEAHLLDKPLGRRRVDQITTPGRCGNLDYCSIGMQRVVVRVPVSQPFTCPECGSRLRPPGRVGSADRPAWHRAARAMLVLAGIALPLAVGFELGRQQGHPLRVTAAPMPEATVPMPTTAASPAPIDRPIDHHAEGSPVLVVNQPHEWRARGADSPSPPGHLKGETRFGQLTIDCLLRTGQVRPLCHVADLRGADTLSASALDWLDKLDIRYESGGAAAWHPPDHRWRIVVQDFSGAPAPQSAGNAHP